MSTTRHYSQFQTALAGLVGVPTNRVTTELAAAWQSMFNSAMSDIWDDSPWREVTPRGEARFAGNRLSDCNNLADTTYWTPLATTATANVLQNPADGLTTSSLLLETSATSQHEIHQGSLLFSPSTSYATSVYARPHGRQYIVLYTYDGYYAHYSSFDLINGTVGALSSQIDTATISRQPNGFLLCRITFTTDAALYTSSNPAVHTTYLTSTETIPGLTYAGDATKGAYFWGHLIQQTSNVPLNDSVIAWDQPGEEVIDTVFDVYANSPFSTQNPTRLTYNLTTPGIQMINASPVAYNYYVNGIAQQSIFGAVPSNPLFLYYRKVCPTFMGDAYDDAATYAVTEQIYFTNSAGYGDFYKCIVATTAGQSPDTTAASWQLLPVYAIFFQYCLYQAYSDWLISDGQMDKAAGARVIANEVKDDAYEVRERQEGEVTPMKTQTHLSAQARVF